MGKSVGKPRLFNFLDPTGPKKLNGAEPRR